VPRPRHTRSTSTLTKARPIRPIREKRSSSWRPFSLPISSRVPNPHINQANLTHLQAPTSLGLASSCPADGRHLSGACTCPPDFGYHGNPHGRPTPRSSYSALRIDTSNKPNGPRPPGNSVVPPVNTAGPSSIPFPSTSSTRPYLRPVPLSLPKGTDEGADSERWCTPCYIRTPSSTRLSPARVPGSGPNKLTKRRPPNSPQSPTSPISPLVPPDLSPLPLSSLDIASAKLAPVSVPPLTLPEYITSSRRRHLTLRELADREEMAGMLHSARPVSLPLQQNV
jgi:hypothetical protein